MSLNSARLYVIKSTTRPREPLVASKRSVSLARSNSLQTKTNTLDKPRRTVIWIITEKHDSRILLEAEKFGCRDAREEFGQGQLGDIAFPRERL